SSLLLLLARAKQLGRIVTLRHFIQIEPEHASRIGESFGCGLLLAATLEDDTAEDSPYSQAKQERKTRCFQHGEDNIGVRLRVLSLRVAERIRIMAQPLHDLFVLDAVN